MRRARLSFGLCVGLAGVWLSAAARAQEPGADAGVGEREPGVPQPEPGAQPRASGEQTIADPELAGTPLESPAAGGSEVISAPELGGSAPLSSSAPPDANGEVHVLLRSRLAVDTQWQGREDVWESTHIALFEARVRRSENLRFAVGLRARYMFAARAHEHASDPSGAERYELDVAPTAAYADVTAADGLHLRIGYQSVLLGRFDVLNPSDMLSVYDLRSGVTTMPEANEIAQPALRVDWDIASWLGLTAIALPFFEPHRVHAVDGDYAIAPLTGAASLGIDATFQRTTLSRSGQAQLGDSAFYAFAPEPSFTHPQAALRLNAHGADGELGFTAGIAREHLPAPHYSEQFLRAFNTANTPNPMPGMVMLPDPSTLTQRPFGFDYDPFELLSLDAATELGPVQIGAEVAYMFHRTFLSSLATPSTLPADALDRAEHTDLAHGGVRAEFAQGAWVAVLEASAERAMQPPSAGRSYAFLARGRWLLSSVGFVAFSPGEIGLTLELGAALLNGPTYLLTPRVEQRLFSGFFAEAGAYFLGGKHYANRNDPRTTLGALYDNIDQVFVGLRWLP